MTMDSEEFLETFRAQFEVQLRPFIHMQTVIKQIEGWSSLQALIVTLAIHEKTGFTFSNDDLKNAITVEDLYKRIAPQF